MRWTVADGEADECWRATLYGVTGRARLHWWGSSFAQLAQRMADRELDDVVQAEVTAPDGRRGTFVRPEIGAGWVKASGTEAEGRGDDGS